MTKIRYVLGALVLLVFCCSQILASDVGLAATLNPDDGSEDEGCTAVVWTTDGEQEVSLDEVSLAYSASGKGYFDHRAFASGYTLTDISCQAGGPGSSSCSIGGCTFSNPSSCSVGGCQGNNYACCNCGGFFSSTSCLCEESEDDGGGDGPVEAPAPS